LNFLNSTFIDKTIYWFYQHVRMAKKVANIDKNIKKEIKFGVIYANKM